MRKKEKKNQTKCVYVSSRGYCQLSCSSSTGHASQSNLCSHQNIFSYRFPCSVGSHQHSQGIKKSDDLIVFILNTKAPHPLDAHLAYLWHCCCLKEKEREHFKVRSIEEHIAKVDEYWLLICIVILKFSWGNTDKQAYRGYWWYQLICWVRHLGGVCLHFAATDLHWLIAFSKICRLK